MRRLLTLFLAAAFTTGSVFAGALTLQLDDPTTNREAMAKKAIVAAHISACHSPEKTVVTATAEGIVNGKRESIPLKVIPLSEPGAFAVAREWPREGAWTVKMVATNPEYKDYATSIVVPIGGNAANRATAKVFYHAATADEVDSILKQATLE
jgi:hypothetical protein